MTSTRNETVLDNARIVLADRVIECGWIAFADGRVAEFGEGNAPAGSEDAAGDLIMPGLIELHTDHLEAHYVPRPKVFWDPIAAVVSYDGQLATSGITTVLDSLRVWREDGAEEVDGRAGVLAEAIASARDADMLRADHFLHLRCEIPMPDVVEEAKELIGRPDVRLMSLMDHTPGQRQFRDENKLRDYYRGKGAGMTDAELDTLFERRFAYQKAHAADNMREIVALAHLHEIPLASHDDTTDENVTDAIRDRVSVAEFPTTMEAARGLHRAGIGILMGAPNVVRGLNRGRKFRHRNPITNGVGDVLVGGVVVTGQRDLVQLRQCHDLAHVRGRICLLIGKAPFEQRIEFGIGHAGALAAIIGAQLAFVAKLALSRGVIHQRHQPHIRPSDQFLGFLDDARHRNFAAQMQEMI